MPIVAVVLGILILCVVFLNVCIKHTLWLFNIAMENHGKPFMNRPFSMAMLNNQMVDVNHLRVSVCLQTGEYHGILGPVWTMDHLKMVIPCKSRDHIQIICSCFFCSFRSMIPHYAKYNPYTILVPTYFMLDPCIINI